MSDCAIRISGLTRKYKDFTLNDINFEVQKGTIMGLVGENGAGKTTIIKSIMNICYIDDGKIEVFGHDSVKEDVITKNMIGYVAAEDYLVGKMTITSLSKAFSGIYDEWNQEIVTKYSEQWNLPMNKRFSSFSKGMKVKAMLLLALAHNPKVLVLDEPTAGLDPLVRLEILDLLRDFVDNGENVVLFSTHITTDLDKIADYLTIISHGEMAGSESIDSIEDKYVLISGNNELLEDSGVSGQLIGVMKSTNTFKALAKREEAELFNNKNVHIKTPDIEEIMVHFVKERN